MSSTKEKIDLLHNIIKQIGITDLNWCGELLHPYYEHFNDDNLRYRAGSLIAFWGLLLEWEDGSGFPFYTGNEKYDCHHFDKYLEEFLKYSPNIKRQYPNTYFVIIESLNHLDKREDFEDKFPNITSDLFNTVRINLLENDVQKPNKKVHQYVLREDALREAGMSF